MASAQDMRRRIATVITPVANLVAAQGPGGALRQVLEIAIDGYGRLPSEGCRRTTLATASRLSG
jgi:hypothetical protein